MRRAAGVGVALALAGLCLSAFLACATGEVEGPDYDYTRDDYFAFRSQHPQLLEPNYLPFMAWRVPVAPRQGITGWLAGLRDRVAKRQPAERLVLCHWSKRDFPLAVYVEPPKIPARLKDELHPVRTDGYVDAVDDALAMWQRDLDDAVRFRRVAKPADAVLTIRLVAGPAARAAQDVEVLGTTPVRGSCRVEGGDPASGHLDVRFRVREVRVSVADRFGLLLPDQVQRLALHEIGHALGMRGHSPEPVDLMYAVARDRLPPDGLGQEDVNSFLSLYALPSGTIYADPDRPHPANPARLLPKGPPRLDIAPYVDARLGFDVQVPAGWMRVPTRYGLAVVNGVPWDYEASVQVNVFRYDTVAQYLQRFGRAYLRDSEVVSADLVTAAGRQARRLVLDTDRGSREEITFLASGDGRVIVILAESPLGLADEYHAWFAAMVSSLEIEEEGGKSDERNRDYTPEGTRTP